MKLVAILAVPFLAFLLGGCTGMRAREGGTTLVGAFPAAGLGSVAARAMDKTDRGQAARALESVPSGQSANWRNRETGDSFVLTPTRTFEQLGATCREFTVRVEVGGRADTAFGSACRKDDGSWHMSG
ncbi:RT0821/Lpp0805 family surface protein [Variovorax sp. EBFNA2]|uniref:RT0821/Lpp0805 family surface protein n=1 Tax=Variovorax sp. EBFNA2 TaxID=3342097 RepID=UPI0029C0AAE0|nr:RT0821/Lpp0805 family surface protein [Variovorax boronicumulans]WPG40890.1 RT0821/Lpp0805 family surface protein [Variovorax boronicumulans]